MDLQAPSKRGNWSDLGPDITELILSRLPIKALAGAANTVCKEWTSLISSRKLIAGLFSKPWLFMFVRNMDTNRHEAFALVPTRDEWICLTSSMFPPHLPCPYRYHYSPFFGADGRAFNITPDFISYAYEYGILEDGCRKASSSLMNVASSSEEACDGSSRVVIFGIVVPLYGTDVVIRDSQFRKYYFCQRLPEVFQSTDKITKVISSVSHNGKIYLSGKYNGHIASFDLYTHRWGGVLNFGPPYVGESFLVSCESRLVVVRLYDGHASPTSPKNQAALRLWELDEKTMHWTLLSTMPSDLCDVMRRSYQTGSSDGTGVASLRLGCVGTGNLIYVYNKNPYPAGSPHFVCEVGSVSGKCSWRMLPVMPAALSDGDGLTGFCSVNPPHDIMFRRIMLGY